VLSIGAAVLTIVLKSLAWKLPEAHVVTHLEPREDPVSWDDRQLDRPRDR
jgi:hypothetical protein